MNEVLFALRTLFGFTYLHSQLTNGVVCQYLLFSDGDLKEAIVLSP